MNSRESKLALEDKMKMDRLLNLKEQELNDWKSKYYRIEKTMSEIKGSDTQVVQVFAEIERLKHVLILKENEIEKWM